MAGIQISSIHSQSSTVKSDILMGLASSDTLAPKEIVSALASVVPPVNLGEAVELSTSLGENKQFDLPTLVALDPENLKGFPSETYDENRASPHWYTNLKFAAATSAFLVAFSSVYSGLVGISSESAIPAGLGLATVAYIITHIWEASGLSRDETERVETVNGRLAVLLNFFLSRQKVEVREKA